MRLERTESGIAVADINVGPIEMPGDDDGVCDYTDNPGPPPLVGHMKMEEVELDFVCRYQPWWGRQ